MSSAPTLSGFWACGEAITAIEKEWWAAAEQHTIKAEHKDTLASTRTILSTHQETQRAIQKDKFDTVNGCENGI